METSVYLKYTKGSAVRIGFDLLLGAAQALAVIFAALVLLGLLIDALRLRPIDSTDAGYFERSGMRPRVDALTGCHYLETSGGGLTPRLDRAGRQVCGGPS
jgi:hypothetical protein